MGVLDVCKGISSESKLYENGEEVSVVSLKSTLVGITGTKVDSELVFKVERGMWFYEISHPWISKFGELISHTLCMPFVQDYSQENNICRL